MHYMELEIGKKKIKICIKEYSFKQQDRKHCSKTKYKINKSKQKYSSV